MFDLSGKIALITGSSRGLGLSIAKALFNSGATIILNGRNPEALDLASQEINPKERIIYKYPFLHQHNPNKMPILSIPIIWS